MTDPATIDGTAEEVPNPDADQPAAAPPAPEPSAGTALVVAAPGAGAIIAAEQPEQILEKATTIANALKGLIDGQNLAVSVGGTRKHVEVGAWQACGTLLGALGGQPLHAETVWTRIVRDPATGDPVRRTYTAVVKRYRSNKNGGGLREEVTYDVDGYDWEACVEVRTPSGVVVGRAEAMCSRAEASWAQRDDYAVRSMAETRAESRAYRRAIGWIVHLAGYSPTPAEEVGHTPGAEPAAPEPVAPAEASAELAEFLEVVLGYLLDHNAESVASAVSALRAHFEGKLPATACQAVVIAGREVKQHRERAAGADADPGKGAA